MEVGQRCRLRLPDATRVLDVAAGTLSSILPPTAAAAASTSGAPPVPPEGFAVTGVVIGMRVHAEDATRRLCYVHATHIEFGAELARQRRKAAAPSWSGAALGTVGSGTEHSYNELRSTGNGFVSADGYRYSLDGWYDEGALYPLPAPATASAAAAATPAGAGAGPGGEEARTSAERAAASAVQSREVPEEWVAAMDRDSAVCEVVYLCYAFQPWFVAPYAALQYLAPPDDDVCHSVYVCHRCLSPLFTREQYYVHLAGLYCRLHTPPGRLLYHDVDGGFKAFLVDGAKHLHYCRCLSLLGKQCIESKLLCNDVDLYEYVVVTMPRGALPYIPGPAPAPTPSDEAFREAARTFDAEDWGGDAVMGYLSRLKHQPDHALSCILTLPMFQRTRVATFLLDLAYWMTQRRQRRCGCALCGTSGGAVSRPFSPHGQSLLLSYWRRALLRSLAAVVPLPPRAASRTAPPPAPRFTLAELRALLDVPLHASDLEMLLLQSEFTFYHAAPRAAGAMRGGDTSSTSSSSSEGEGDSSGDEHRSATTSSASSPASASGRPRARRSSGRIGASSNGSKGTAAASATGVPGASAPASVAATAPSPSAARYEATLVLEPRLLEAATASERHAKSSHACARFDRRWLVRDSRGVYAYDVAQFHY